MARTTGDTFAEGMRKILGQLGEMSMLPDADLEFITSLQGMIAGYMRNAVSTGGGEMQMPGGPQTGMMPPGPPPMPPSGGMGMPPMQGGAMPGLSVPPPNMEELSRTLGRTDMAQ